MPDALDNEAMEFMSSKNRLGSQKTAFSDIQVDLGGKRIKTKVPKRDIQKFTKTYISDEPERFVEYVKELKNDFINEEQAVNAIITHWKKRDDNLKHMIEGLEKEGKTHLKKEIAAIVNTKKVQAWLSYRVVAKRLNITPEVFAQKKEKFTDTKKVDALLEKIAAASSTKERNKVSIKRKDLFIQQREGTLNGKKVIGKLKFVKIFSKRVPKYIDPVTKRYIKV